MISIIFCLLICGHFLADFSLQSEYMALGKNKWNPLNGTPWYWPMLAHCSIHGLVAGLAIFLSTFKILPFAITLALIIGLFEFALHFIIDCLKCKKMINYDIDQLLHITCKMFYVIIVLLLI